MTGQRDPRADPQPRDRLHSKRPRISRDRWVRPAPLTVIAVGKLTLHYREADADITRWMYRSQWRAEMHDADVIHIEPAAP